MTMLRIKGDMKHMDEAKFVTLGTAACSTTLLTGSGAVLSMDTTITNTSGLPGGQSDAKLRSIRTPSLS